MKKIIAIAIVAIMMLSLVSCSAKTCGVGDLTIQLPATYVDATDVLNTLIGEEALGSSNVTISPYISAVDGMAIVVAEEKYDSVGYGEDSLEDFFDFDEMNKVINVNGEPAYEFEQNVGETDLKGFVVLYSGEEGYYAVVFACSADKYEAKKDQMIEYASTIEVE